MAQGLGYCPDILLHLAAMAGCNPAKKLRPMGFLAAVLSAMDGATKAEVNKNHESGHVKGATVEYSKRPLVSDVRDTPGACDIAVTPRKFEFNLPNLLYREISFWMPDELIRQYCEDASKYVKINGNTTELNQNTSVMQEVYDEFIKYGGALLSSINAALVTQQATQFGKNLMTDSTAATELAFSLGSNGMQDAFVNLMVALRENEVCDDVIMVGNGPFANLDLIRKWFANAAADNGLNKANILASFPEVYFDKDTRPIWGNNQIGVFEKGALALVSYDQYVGSFARKIANTEKFTAALPIDEYCCPQDQLDKLNFDIQIREVDCPTEMTINGVPTTVSDGVQITTSKYFSLFTRPANLWLPGDPLDGVNGTWRYQITEAPAA